VRIIIYALIALGLLAGDAAVAARRGGGTQVYLLRGIFNVSVGLDALAVKLARRGIPSAVYGHAESFVVAEQAMRDYRAGKVRSIILVGHSLGAGAAISVAEQLNQAGLPVALIVSLDPVSAVAVPGNVRRVVNFYISRSGSALAGGPGFHGALRNVDMTDAAGVDHMTIQSMESMHRRVMREIGGR
jgi:pimeloyl-ACP methyl ester carboxylesterase